MREKTSSQPATLGLRRLCTIKNFSREGGKLTPVINANPVTPYAVGTAMFTVFFLHITRFLLFERRGLPPSESCEGVRAASKFSAHLYSLIFQLIEIKK